MESLIISGTGLSKNSKNWNTKIITIVLEMEQFGFTVPWLVKKCRWNGKFFMVHIFCDLS